MNTIEGAMVLSAIAVTAGALAAGLVTLSTSMSAQSTARDVSRIAALGDEDAAIRLAQQAGGRAEISRQAVDGSDWAMLTVRFTTDAPLFDVTAEQSILEEPRD